MVKAKSQCSEIYKSISLCRIIPCLLYWSYHNNADMKSFSGVAVFQSGLTRSKVLNVDCMC